ncbi:MAG: universal stress protein [Gammaproteobacteria bacterium]|nr:universal stress protein [Gammaproteobacteria bacterium]
MQRFKNILLVLSPEVESIATLNKAVLLAESNGARLTLISVVERHPKLRNYLEKPPPSVIKAITSERRVWSEQQLKPVQKKGLDALSVVATGIPFIAIIQEVLRQQHDLVILTAEKEKSISMRVFGSTSMHLMRKCPCPVWVGKRAQTWPYTRILAAVDPLSPMLQQDSLNPFILQLAANMARKEEGEFHITHVWNSFVGNYGVNLSLTEEEIEQDKILYKNNFDALLEQADVTDLKPCVHFIEGEPQACISELVVEKNIDLLVMGTVCRTGIAGFLIGNTAEEVLNQVDCSVLAVKPEGFVTPVELE